MIDVFSAAGGALFYKGYDPVKDEETDDEAIELGNVTKRFKFMSPPYRYRRRHADKGEILLYNILENYYTLCISIVGYSCFSKSDKLVLVYSRSGLFMFMP